jgi:DNA-binding CsgD family transcriptional regulator
MAFFTVIPERRRGFWIGGMLSAGFVLWRVLQNLTHSITDTATAELWYSRIFVIQTAATFLMAALIGYCLLKLPAESSAPAAVPEPAISPAGPGAKPLALALFLFYLANGFTGVQLSPDVPAQNINQGIWPLYFLVVIACPLFGLYLDRYRNGAKTLLFVCSLLLILAPTLNFLSGSPVLHSLLLTLGALTQFAVLVTATVAVAGLGTGFVRYGLAFLAPVVLRLVTHFAYTASQEMPALGGGTSVFLATVAAVGCNLAVRRMPDGGESGREKERAAVPAPETASTNSADGIEEICRQYSLTPREGTVLRLLAEGCGTSDIAGQLGISEHTVKTHLRNLMAKSAVSSRNALLVKLLHGV